jgi:hypothetical protein
MNVYDVHLSGVQETKLIGVVKDIQADSREAAYAIALAKDHKYGIQWTYAASVYKDVAVVKAEQRTCAVIYNTDFYQKFFRERKQFTLGELIEKMEMLDPATLIKMQFSELATDFTSHSYRGYYEQLAIYPAFRKVDSPLCVGQFVRFLKTCLNHTYDGWKGGEYSMFETTPVWVSDRGESSGAMLVGLDLNTAVTPPFVTLLTSMED